MGEETKKPESETADKEIEKETNASPVETKAEESKLAEQKEGAPEWANLINKNLQKIGKILQGSSEMKKAEEIPLPRPPVVEESKTEEVKEVVNPQETEPKQKKKHSLLDWLL